MKTTKTYKVQFWGDRSNAYETETVEAESPLAAALMVCDPQFSGVVDPEDEEQLQLEPLPSKSKRVHRFYDPGLDTKVTVTELP